MRKVLSLFALGALTAMGLTAAPQAASASFYGFDDINSTGAAYGLYEYTLDGTATLVHQLSYSTPIPTAGAFVRDGKYCYYTCDLDGEGTNYVEIDLESGAVAKTALAGANTKLYSVALNPADGNLYGIAWDGSETAQFGIVDPATHTLTPRGESSLVDELEYLPRFLSFTAEGKGYALQLHEGGNTFVYAFDVFAGQDDWVASIVEGLPFNAQKFRSTGAAIDPATGLFTYYASPKTNDCAFYTIDPATGEATLQCSYPATGYAAIKGIAYKPVEGPEVDESAIPAAVSDLTVTDAQQEDGSVTLNVSYTMPTTMADGVTPIDGGIFGTCPVRVDIQGAGFDETYNEQYGYEIGANVVCEYTVPAAGIYQVTVRAYSYAYDAETEEISYTYGLPATVTDWYGEDVPGAPRDVMLTADLGTQTFTLTWTAPEGKHGKPYNAEYLTYNVNRIVNGESMPVRFGIEETTFTETLDIAELSTVTYSVTAWSTLLGEECGTTVAPETYEVGEEPNLTLPVLYNFTSADQLNEFLIVDANADGFTWQHNAAYRAVAYSYNQLKEADDWLLSRAIPVEEGKTYTFEFDEWRGMFDERVELKVGYERTPEAMTEVVIESHMVTTQYSTRAHQSGSYTATQSGLLYFGLHAISDKFLDKLYVTNISVTEAEEEEPEVPGTETTVADFDLSDYSVFGQFVIEDNNGDGKKWQYGMNMPRAAYYPSFAYKEGDDWLISPAIEVTAGKSYSVEVVAWSSNSASYCDRLEVKAGYTQTGEGMTVDVIEAYDVLATSNAPMTATGVFTATETGALYVGLHAISKAYCDGLYVSHITVRESTTVGLDRTAIDSAESGVMYDLYGRRVERAEAGQVYILNGKTIIRK